MKHQGVPVDLPIEAGPPPTWTPAPRNHRMLITGAAGMIATSISGQLAETFELIGADVVPITAPEYTATYTTDLTDTELLEQLISTVDYVLHFATGVKNGRQGLYDVEMTATERVLRLAIHYGVHRVVLASSTHAAGWYERDLVAGRGDGKVGPYSMPRPDGLYGAAKLYMESLGRFAADWAGLPVSILRIGTMRTGMTKEDLIASDQLPYLGTGTFRTQRLSRSWLEPADLVHILAEELQATETFRIRYATSTPDQQEWDHSVITD